MAAQKDLVPELDVSSLTSVTASQLLQALNTLTPLDNIGGIVVQAGTSLAATIAQGTSGSPSITDNPRFERYIWLNTYNTAAAAPTPYYYDPSTGNWTSSSIAAGSISNSHVNAAAAIAVTKLAFGTARYVLRTNAAGTALEFVSPAGINQTNEIPVNNLVVGGSNGYLKSSGGSVVWVTDATERAAIQTALSNLAVTVLAPGANNTLLGTNSSGIVKFDSIGNLLVNGAIGLALINSGGASQYDVLEYSGSVWEKKTPAVNFLQGATINTGITVGALGGSQVYSQAHGLGGTPKQVRVVAVCATIDNGYAVGDELDIHSLRDAGNVSAGVCADGTNITVLLSSAAGNSIPNKGTGVYAAMTEASWNLKIYAWK